ncbi:hypothetical protein BDA96_10G039100 [Sorghum bicolor]|uniref:Uncharacterized protein n=1 Tax=Sorghum bicolor TaxID=4558 RepID=A0A921Q1K0_SORBI|nr:hypothetical protein BDA96_10G039100 [Sorghum bicolor]
MAISALQDTGNGDGGELATVKRDLNSDGPKHACSWWTAGQCPSSLIRYSQGYITHTCLKRRVDKGVEVDACKRRGRSVGE